MQQAAGESRSAALTNDQQPLDPGVFILKDYKLAANNGYSGRMEVWYRGNFDKVEQWTRVDDTAITGRIPKHERLDTVVSRTEDGKSKLWQITDEDQQNTILTKLPDGATVRLVTDPFKFHAQALSAQVQDKKFLFSIRDEYDNDEDETGSTNSQSTVSDYVSSQGGGVSAPIDWVQFTFF